MKRIFNRLFVVLFSILVICCKDDDLNGDRLNATIDGESYKATDVSAYFSATNNTTLIIKGRTNNGKNINLIINGYDGPATYNYKGQPPFGTRALCTYSHWGDNSAIYTYTTEDADDNGSITVSKLEGSKVEGTFSFTAYSPHNNKEVVVTNGTFRANF